MTLLRKAAVSVSGFVARHTSAGSREWAEGLAREAEVIDGDWAALGWSLGSLRVLFQNPPEPLRNSAEIARAGRLFAGSREHVPPVASLLTVLWAFDYAAKAVFPTGHISSWQRAGFAIAAVSAVYLAMVAWMDWRMRERPEDMDDAAWIGFYRTEMERRRDLYRGFGTLCVAACFLLMAGVALGVAGTARPYLALCLIAPWALLAWLIPQPAQRFQRKVEQLDSILEPGRGDA
jgi:hypothetical protein